MKLSEAWLREWVNPDVDTDTLVSQLTMGGLEVDAVEPVAGEFNNVVVGEIISREQHPDADRLSVCKVDVNEGEPLQIVCGAKNAREGIRIPCAKIGAVLPGNFKIKKSKLRGVESYGMLCAGAELGLEEESDGLLELPLDAPVGDDIRDYLQLNDNIIEVDLTPNRGDCLSIAGVAREVAVINQAPLNELEVPVVAAAINETVPVAVAEPEACPVYIARVINNVNAAAPTPMWMVERLRRAGIRSLSFIVDVTNYVLLELGQPMHAFDKAKISGGIQARKAKTDEPLTLLDGAEVKLNNDCLVIADEKQALAFAGVMGGESSAVTTDTQNIVLEAAHFAPLAIAGKARAFGLHTDSSHRFERGVDPALPQKAMQRATALILEYAGGEAGELNIVTSGEIAPVTIALRREKIKSLLGIELADAEVVDIFQRLGMQVEATGNGGWNVAAPTNRFDMAIEADLIEELARIVGYDKLPVEEWSAAMVVRDVNEAQTPETEVKQRLVARGYQEAITYSFVAKEQLTKLLPEADPIMLANPISADMAAMRTSLVPGLLATLEYNVNRQAKRVRLFETGLKFVQGNSAEEITQTPMIAGVVYGEQLPEQWAAKAEKIDFYDVKSDITALFGNAQLTWKAAQRDLLHPGQSADIYLDEQYVGYMGALHPSHSDSFGFAAAPFVFELDLAAVTQANIPVFEAVSKFPAIRRDLALLVKADIAAESLCECIRNANNPLVKDVFIFDVYQGQGIDSGFKSIALAVVLQDKSATLVDEQTDAIIAELAQKLANELGASIRE